MVHVEIDLLPDIHKEYEYKTFEQICADAEYIVIANYVDAINYSDQYAKFVYNVKESLVGDISGNIDIYAPVNYKRPYVYEFVEIDGEKHYFDGEDVYTLQAYACKDGLENAEFVMFLMLEDLEGFDEPQYVWYCATVVNLTYLSESKIYSLPLADHIEFDISAATKESMLEYIESIISNRNENQ